MRLLFCTIFLLSRAAEGRSNAAFTRGVPLVKATMSQKTCFELRGGAADDDDEIDELIDELIEEMEEEDSEEEEEEELDPKLTKSAIESSSKSKKKKTVAAKKEVSSTLKSKKKAKTSMMKAMKVPYIIRAFMNPFTVVAMIKAYFASLFNFNYLKEDNTQGLRSAMEEKAKRSGGSPKKKGKRQMRPGQAKTLSDLPVLSA